MLPFSSPLVYGSQHTQKAQENVVRETSHIAKDVQGEKQRGRKTKWKHSIRLRIQNRLGKITNIIEGFRGFVYFSTCAKVFKPVGSINGRAPISVVSRSNHLSQAHIQLTSNCMLTPNSYYFGISAHRLGPSRKWDGALDQGKAPSSKNLTIRYLWQRCSQQ
jgi:hypothetical protein